MSAIRWPVACSPTASASRAACPRSAAAPRPDSGQGSGASRSPVAPTPSRVLPVLPTLSPVVPALPAARRRGLRQLQDHVRVGPAHPERRHPGPARPSASRARAAASVSSRTAPADQSTCGVGSSTCSVRGSTPCRSACTILITPADAGGGLRVADVRLQRSQPQRLGRRRARPRRRPAAPAPRSGRPARCRCRAPRRRPRRRRRARRAASAARITRCCDGPFGAVRPLDAPSWFTAEPRDHGQHLVAQPARVGQPLQQQQRRRPRPSRCRPPRRRTPCSGRRGPDAALAGELDEDLPGSTSP